MPSLGVVTISLGARTTSLGAPRSTSNRIIAEWDNDIFFVNVAGAPGNLATAYCSTIFKIHVFSLYLHLSIYIATNLHTEYLDRLQVVLECNSMCP
jgi:hypothetical protein